MTEQLAVLIFFSNLQNLLVCLEFFVSLFNALVLCSFFYLVFAQRHFFRTVASLSAKGHGFDSRSDRIGCGRQRLAITANF